jgi:hypothetical protein
MAGRSTTMENGIRCLCGWVVAATFLAGPAIPTARGDDADEGPRGAVSPERIQRAIDKARDWLVRQQEPNGSWECTLRTENTRIGASALVMLALTNAGLTRDHLAMQRGLDWIRRQKPDDTYSVSLQTMLLAMVSPDADRPILQRNVDWLENLWKYLAEYCKADLTMMDHYTSDLVGSSIVRIYRCCRSGADCRHGREGRNGFAVIGILEGVDSCITFASP